MSWKDKIRNPNCTLCPLHESAEHICLMGSGKRKATIMVVGEAPGEREDDSHLAFVGPSGQLLRRELDRVGLDPKTLYITNAAKCRPPNNRAPERSEVKICANEYLARELAAINPRWVLTLGNSSLLALTKHSGITKHRGSIYKISPQTRVFATYHPAYVLRNPAVEKDFRADLTRFANLVSGKHKPPKTKTMLITTKGQLRQLRAILMKADYIAYDIETRTHHNLGTNFQEWRGPRSTLVTIGFSWEAGKAAVVPLYHVDNPWDPDWYQRAIQTPNDAKFQSDRIDAILHYLKPALERSDAKYIAHNGKFDCRWLAAKGIFVRQDFDTMLAAHLLDENRLKGLKPLSQIELGADAYGVGEDLANAHKASLSKLAVYNAKDCDYTLQLYFLFREQLKAQPRLARVFVKLLMPSSNSLTRVERRGLWADHERLERRYGKLSKIEHQLRIIMSKELPPEVRSTFNFNSPQQLSKWLFNDLDLPILEYTPKGQPSTRESVLQRLSKKHKGPRAMLKWRKYTKYRNTYLTPWTIQRDHISRIHTTYKLYGTVTGRLSSTDPNLQQVPRDKFIRTILGAPPGWRLVEADYSQIELRVAAMLAGEKRMQRAFLAGEDLHLKTAVETTGKLPSEITPEERKKAKAVNFGFLYGMWWRKFIEYARDNYDVEVTEDEARKVRERFFEAYPALKPWHDRQKRLANRYEQVHSPIGRVRHLPTIRSSSEEMRMEAERQAINSPVQSFASDLMLIALNRLDRLLPERRARVVGTVHDAILFEVHESVLEETCAKIQQTMTDTGYVQRLFGTRITVPIEVELKVGQYWGEGQVWVP